MGRFRTSNSGLWALVFLSGLMLFTGLLVYIDQRFGPEASAFFLGITIGLPILVVIVALVGAIYVLIVRGTVHQNRHDDAGEIERMRALRELARSERAFHDLERKRLVHASSPVGSPSQGAEHWRHSDWSAPEPDPSAGANGYRILE